MAYLLDKQLNTPGTPLQAQNDACPVPAGFLRNAQNLSIYVEFIANSAAGTVLVEGAHDDGYTGTWATLATIAWAAATRVHMAAIVGCHKAVRVRVSSAITSGGVNVYAVVN